MASAPVSIAAAAKPRLWPVRLIMVLGLAGLAYAAVLVGPAMILALPLALPCVWVLFAFPRPTTLPWARGIAMLVFPFAVLDTALLAVVMSGLQRLLALIPAAIALLCWFAIGDAARLWEIQAQQGTARGSFRGKTALAIAYCLVCFFLAAVAIPSLEMPTGSHRDARNEASAVGSLRMVHTAMKTYEQQHPNQPAPEKLSALGDAIPPELACPLPSCVRNDYRFFYSPLPSDAAGLRFSLLARPEQYGKRGRRSFYVDQTGFIRWTGEDRACTDKDPPLQ